MNRTFPAQTTGRRNAGGGRRPELGSGAATWPRLPLLLWAAVMAAALLSFYVHVLNEQVRRGERLREARRSAGSIVFPGRGLGDGERPSLSAR